MKIVVLGATGTTGQLLCNQALANGHDVIAFVRTPGALQQRAGLTIVEGSVEDQNAMRQSFTGADAVVSCLGERPSFRTLSRGSDFQRRTLPKIVSAINDADVKRFVLMSSFGSGATAAKAGLFMRVILYSLIARRLFDDKAIAEEALARCTANWTAVYPVTLIKAPAIPATDLVSLDRVTKVPGVPRVPFLNVAQALIRLVPDTTRSEQKLLLTTPGGWRA